MATKKTGRDICKLTSSESELGELIVRSKCLMQKAFRGVEIGGGDRTASVGEPAEVGAEMKGAARERVWVATGKGRGRGGVGGLNSSGRQASSLEQWECGAALIRVGEVGDDNVLTAVPYPDSNPAAAFAAQRLSTPSEALSPWPTPVSN